MSSSRGQRDPDTLPLKGGTVMDLDEEADKVSSGGSGGGGGWLWMHPLLRHMLEAKMKCIMLRLGTKWFCISHFGCGR